MANKTIVVLIVTAVLIGAMLAASAPGQAQGPVKATSIALSVNAAANRKAISPYIYGLNFAKESFANEIDLPVRRWGGNTTTRYNWQGNFTNHGSDWFFHNNTNYDPYTGNDQTADQWVDQNERTASDSLITTPMTGYVAKDGSQTSCGFKVSKYGPQDDVDNESGYPDCGNGLSGDTPITGNNPLDTSITVNPSFVTGWVNHLKATHGAASAGGVKFYALDNEPELWNETHRDIHPSALRYDELINRSLAYGAAVKAADPASQIFGYASFGWSGYWNSQYDLEQAEQNSYTYFPDYATHGNQYQVVWYLRQMCGYEKTKGTRLLDYLDLHFYPQNGVDLSLAGTPFTQTLRLRSIRALWDPTYVDESWIAEAGPEGGIVRLIPRMRDWVNAHYPGTKLAITEYNWGGLEHINGALAQADILGIFGREGLDLATLWNYPDPNSDLGYENFESQPGAYAFRLYRNYNGNGGKFGDISVSAASADQSQLALYAAERSSDGALTLVVINKTGGALTGNVSLAGFTPSGAAQVFRYSAANLNVIVPQSDQSVTSAGFSASFPANSMTLVVIPGASAFNTSKLYLPLVSKPSTLSCPS